MTNIDLRKCFMANNAARVGVLRFRSSYDHRIGKSSPRCALSCHGPPPMCCESIAYFRLAEARIVQLKFYLVNNFAAKSCEVGLSEYGLRAGSAQIPTFR